MSYIFETLNVLDKKGKPRKMRKKISNPSTQEKWFYFIENKNTFDLENMLKDGSNIDQIDPNGQTIAHYSLVQKSHKLLNFCIDHNANFNTVDIFNVNPLKVIFQKSYSYYFFKHIMVKYDLEYLVQMEGYKENIFFLVNHDENLLKIKLLFLNYPDIMNTFKNDLKNKSLDSGAIETWKYLSGRGELILRLEAKLINNKKSSIIKI